ncbi:FEKKY domain-containing protein [Pedobacter sp. MW01-1-1]|uniref:FEKKY domain-containing protein n=1 Tax=Pedobacter sp. MW01-1-1 TaxID=3383027 RepID=UPI003FEE9796
MTDEEINSSGATKMTFIEKCDEVENLFKADLKNQTLFLLLQGGIAPVVISTDKDFENKYQVYYYDFGCNAPNLECVKTYNEFVFSHLTKLYGSKWKKTVRKDVIGLKKWKLNKRLITTGSS